MKPLFIVLDGVEGCGKSTQARLLAEDLRARGHDVLLTHEPGGTPVGEAIRHLLLDPRFPEMTALTEMLLFCASRAQHCSQVIAPTLANGRTVVCDRFASSTAVYQGYAGQLGFDLVARVNEVATGGLEPDLLIVLDLDPEIGLRRKFGDRLPSGDRIEEKPLEFHRRIRQGFLAYAASQGNRAVVLDANQDPDRLRKKVTDTVFAAVSENGVCHLFPTE